MARDRFPALKGWAESTASRWDAEDGTLDLKGWAESTASRWDAEDNTLHTFETPPPDKKRKPGLRTPTRLLCEGIQ
jgi:hypothetical protein